MRRAVLDTPADNIAANESIVDKLQILGSPNFSLLWVGGMIAVLGDAQYGSATG